MLFLAMCKFSAHPLSTWSFVSLCQYFFLCLTNFILLTVLKYSNVCCCCSFLCCLRLYIITIQVVNISLQAQKIGVNKLLVSSGQDVSHGGQLPSKNGDSVIHDACRGCSCRNNGTWELRSTVVVH